MACEPQDEGCDIKRKGTRKLTAVGNVSLENKGQVFQFMSCRYCWCTCSPRPYTLALGRRVENCRYWSEKTRGPILESNLVTGKHRNEWEKRRIQGLDKGSSQLIDSMVPLHIFLWHFPIDTKRQNIPRPGSIVVRTLRLFLTHLTTRSEHWT